MNSATKSSNAQVDGAAESQRDEKASHGARPMRTILDEARKAGRVETPAHIRDYRRRRRQLDLLALE